MLFARFLEHWAVLERKGFRARLEYAVCERPTCTIRRSASSGARDAISNSRARRGAAPLDLEQPSLYFNRELSWLDFNDRVLQLAEDPSVPLLERLKFAAIYSSNLDEFFMVRVAGMHEHVDAGIVRPREDGRTPAETVAAIGASASASSWRASPPASTATCARRSPSTGSASSTATRSTRSTAAELDERFRRQIFPVLTPLAVGLGRPFPYISNLSLSLAVLVRDPETEQETFARVKVPKEMLPRFVPIGDGRTFVPLEDLIAQHLDALFPGMEIVDHDVFRVTRDADFEVDDEADDLLRAVEQELRRRRFGEVVRLEVGAGDERARCASRCCARSSSTTHDVYEVDGLLDLNDLWDVVKLPGFDELRDAPWTPVTQPRLQPDEDEPADVIAAMRRGDILVHHPYDSFSTSVERLVEQAVDDPDVLAIKQTVYRTSDDSPLVPALIRAAERGKQAVCLVELKARFDERANIGWARSLEQAGVHVVYGLPALKTHAKCDPRRAPRGRRRPPLRARRDGQLPRRARRGSTPTSGSSPATSEIGADVADMFNHLTGFARPARFAQGARRARPHARRDHRRDRAHDRRQGGGRGRADRDEDELARGQALHPRAVPGLAGRRARRAQHPRHLLPAAGRRGRLGEHPGRLDRRPLPRALAHLRVPSAASEETIYIGSADLMPRNLDTRVELLAPVRDEALRAELTDTLERCMADDTNAWVLGDDGAWERRTPGDPPRNAQNELMARHAARAVDAAAGAA